MGTSLDKMSGVLSTSDDTLKRKESRIPRRRARALNELINFSAVRRFPIAFSRLVRAYDKRNVFTHFGHKRCEKPGLENSKTARRFEAPISNNWHNEMKGKHTHTHKTSIEVRTTTWRRRDSTEPWTRDDQGTKKKKKKRRRKKEKAREKKGRGNREKETGETWIRDPRNSWTLGSLNLDPLPLMNFRAQFQSLRPGCAFTYARH